MKIYIDGNDNYDIDNTDYSDNYDEDDVDSEVRTQIVVNFCFVFESQLVLAWQVATQRKL